MHGPGSNPPISVVMRSKARVCGRSLGVVAGSNPVVGVDVCVLCALRTKGKSQDNQDKEVRLKYRERERERERTKNLDRSKRVFCFPNRPDRLWGPCTVIKDKGKAFPLQAWTGPWGSRRLRLQNFYTIGT